MTMTRQEYLVEYRKRNKERLNAYHQEWVSNNRDKVRVAAKKFIDANPEKNALKSQLRRARLRKVDCFLILDKEIKYLYRQNCLVCNSNKDITIDHRIPISRGGRHSIGNLQTLCKACNSSKKDKTIMEWRIACGAFR